MILRNVEKFIYEVKNKYVPRLFKYFPQKDKYEGVPKKKF